MDVLKFCNKSLASENLVVLSRLMYCLSSALNLYFIIFSPASLSFQMNFRVMAVSQASDRSSPTSPNSNLRMLPGWMLGTCCCKQLTRRSPTSSFLSHRISSCCIVPSSSSLASCTEQILRHPSCAALPGCSPYRIICKQGFYPNHTQYYLYFTVVLQCK